MKITLKMLFDIKRNEHRLPDSVINKMAAGREEFSAKDISEFDIPVTDKIFLLGCILDKKSQVKFAMERVKRELENKVIAQKKFDEKFEEIQNCEADSMLFYDTAEHAYTLLTKYADCARIAERTLFSLTRYVNDRPAAHAAFSVMPSSVVLSREEQAWCINRLVDLLEVSEKGWTL